MTDQPGGMPGRPTGQLLTLEQYDVAPAHLAEMISNGHTDDPAAKGHDHIVPLNARFQQEIGHLKQMRLAPDADFVLTWEPLEALVAASGELGVTWGIYYFNALDELGAPYVAEGKYVYVWRNNNGRWELILDITNQTEPLYEELTEFGEEDLPEDLSPSEIDASQDMLQQQDDSEY